MRDSIVNIESVSNNSFGTGFVIDSDEKGVYLLTCQHVLDDVETPVVENVLARVIAKGGFIDMAVLYVSKLHLEPLPLQTKE
jgi:S1-C subfamily serine protease